MILGDEFDDSLRQKLLEVLRQLGGTSGLANRFLAGSQDLEELDVEIEGHILHIQAETYIGLSISGPIPLVKRVQELLLQ